MPKFNFKRILSFLLKLGAASAFVVLLITMLPAAITDTEPEKPEITYPYDKEMPEIDPTVNPQLFPHIVIIYPDADAWGAEEAEHVKAQLSPRFHAHFVIISDKEYLALDEQTLSLYNAEPSLTLNLGISSLLEGSYLEILSRLGRDGLEITHEGNMINITSASPERINEGVRAFADAIGYDNKLIISEELYICDERPSPETDFKPDIVTDGELNFLVFSYIDTNSYTLRAIEGIVGKTQPDIVIFNGAVDGSASTRHELALMWQGIADALKKTDTPWCFIPGTLSGKLPRITVCEVISSFDGCIRKTNGKESGSFSLTVANTSGEVTASIYLCDSFDSSDELCAKIEADSALYTRASSRKREIIAVYPALSDRLLDKAEGLSSAFVSKELRDIHDCLDAAGASLYICSESSVSPNTVEYSEGTIALGGSIGFDSPGLGGRFDYNHSLRGGLLLTLTPHRAGYTDSNIDFIYAADLGLNER